MKVGDLVLEHIDDRVGIIIEEESKGKDKIRYYRVLFPSGYIGTYSELYLEIAS